MFYTPEQKGMSKEDVERICEILWEDEKEKIGNCHDCGVSPGETHILECDISYCVNCGEQTIFGNCCDNPQASIWTGIWPGIKECYEQKIICWDDGHNMYDPGWRFDLNTLAINKRS